MKLIVLVFYGALTAFLVYMAVFSVVGDSPADRPAWHLTTLFGIAAGYSGRAAWRRYVRLSASRRG